MRSGPLRDPRFRLLLAGLTLASFAVTALYLVLGVWAKALTDSNALAGSVFLALGVPTLFAPLGGVLADRVRRKPLLLATLVVFALTLLSLLCVHSRHQLWLIYLAAAATGLATDLVSACRNGMLKDLLPADQLGSANASLQTLTQGLQLISPLVGAALFATVGGGTFALIDAGLLGGAVLVLARVRLTESDPQPRTGARLLGEVLAGFGHLRSVPLLRQLSIVGAAAFAVIGLFETAGFAVVDQGLHRPPTFYGVLTSLQGAGAILGGLTAGWVLRRLGEARLVGLALAAVGIGALLSASSALPVVLAGLFVLGLGVPWFLVGWSTALQRHTPPRLQGRVGATGGMLLTTPQTASIAVGALLIGVVDYRILLLVIMVGMLACAAVLVIRPAAQPAALIGEPITGPLTAEPGSAPA
ncbi:MAG TPA: MFS transporter [Pseudonocardiaceae bacterium]|jgi:MFS family permease|nr:MFS transporter [Pseudonocardiaceae bacterium]